MGLSGAARSVRSETDAAAGLWTQRCARRRVLVGSVTVLEAPAGVAGFDDVAMMCQAVQHGRGHFGVTKHLRPIGEGKVGGDQQRGVFVELADQMEQQSATRLAE